MTMDLATQLMAATVEVEQPLPDGQHIIGTGFLVSDPTPDGRPRTILVTANHVFDKMPGKVAHLGYRVQGQDGEWRYDPQPLTIRASGGRPLWTRNPSRDVAAIAVEAPPEFARAAIPLSWLADGDAFSRAAFGPGQEMLVLGYPQGLSANSAGFPILRSGRVASPVDATSVSPTFLLDFRVFPGNSGGPVFMAPASPQATPVVVGMLTQQVEMNNERLEIGIVTDAPFVRETLTELDSPHAPAPAAAAPTTVAKASADTASSHDVSAWVGTRVSD